MTDLKYRIDCKGRGLHAIKLGFNTLSSELSAEQVIAFNDSTKYQLYAIAKEDDQLVAKFAKDIETYGNSISPNSLEHTIATTTDEITPGIQWLVMNSLLPYLETDVVVSASRESSSSAIDLPKIEGVTQLRFCRFSVSDTTDRDLKLESGNGVIRDGSIIINYGLGRRTLMSLLQNVGVQIRNGIDWDQVVADNVADREARAERARLYQIEVRKKAAAEIKRKKRERELRRQREAEEAERLPHTQIICLKSLHQKRLQHQHQPLLRLTL